LFIDEIHRFNKLQQDILLPHIEKGNLIIIGSTTENPSFSVNKAILSRSLVFCFQPLSIEELEKLLKNATSKLSVDISEKTLKKIAVHSQGDGRKALNLLEAIYFAGENGFDFLKTNPIYDRNSEEHYNHASALQKSIRGGDPNGAIYWLAKMIKAGEPPEFIARRLMVIAAEDIGNAEPLASILASSVFQTVQNIGMPEGRIPLAQLTVFLAKCEKSNEAVNAIDSAISDIENGQSYPVPNHLKDSHYSDAEKIGGVEEYIYTHSNPFARQTYLPNKLIEKKYAMESELNSLDKEIEEKIINILKKTKTNTLDFKQLSKTTGLEVWKLKKALRFLIKNKKLKVDKSLHFKII
jgi:putative ATPase